MSVSVIRTDANVEEIRKLLERVKVHFTDEEYALLFGVVDTLKLLTDTIEDKTCSLKRLRDMLFGPTSEKTKKVIKKKRGGSEDETPEKQAESKDDEQAKPKDNENAKPKEDEKGKPKEDEKAKPKGHGRNGADAYVGADWVFISHPSLKPKDPCPDCTRGKVYGLPTARMVRLRGQAPVGATVTELERLRCNICGTIFTAPAPEDIHPEKHDERAKSMIAMLKYGYGFPFNRLDRLQDNLGIPLPNSTQWEQAEEVGAVAKPAFNAICDLAAEGDVIHNDDTGATILSIMKENQEMAARGDPPDRTGVFTTGIVSIAEGRRIALFFTGRKHAGENLSDVLAKRKRTKRPIQMCDGLERNLPEKLKTIVANCLVHGRRKFVDVYNAFPVEVQHVLEELGKVYETDAKAREQELSPEERLRLHQQHSAPVMDSLHEWCKGLVDNKEVEDNSSLGKAIAYMLKRWDRLTLFLREPGAPLDNNICERILKIAILNRKNAMFYKSENGARVGDVIMSLIATCLLAGVNAFDYLTALMCHPTQVKDKPMDWLPWNYTLAVASQAERAPTPATPPS